MTTTLTVVALGQVIRTRRRALGLSQQALADLSGLHRTYVGGVERAERNLSFENLATVSNALGLHLSELIADAEKHGEQPR